MIIKKVQKKEDFFIQFTDEELESLNLKKNDKLSIEYNEGDNSCTLKPYAKLEIDLSEFTREALEELIIQSVEKDVSVNEVIEEIIKEYIDKE